MIHHIRNKDIVLKKIQTLTDKNTYLDVVYKHKKQIFFIDPFLEHLEEELTLVKGEDHYTFVVFNTHENFQILLKRWAHFAEYRQLSFFFVNPLSKLDKIWIIFPYTHSMIADPESLELGLKTMFEQIEPVVKEELARMK